MTKKKSTIAKSNLSDDELFDILACSTNKQQKPEEKKKEVKKQIKIESEQSVAFEDLLNEFDDTRIESKQTDPDQIKRTVKDILKDYPHPQEAIDLHGHTAVEAENKLNNFITFAKANSLQTVRVITGKGNHSKNGPVIPDTVELLLIDLKKKKRILTFKWEKKEKKKSGSVTIYL